MTCARLRVHVLGRFRLFASGSPVPIRPRLRKPQELLQALIAFGGSEVGASTLIDALWPESEGDAAYHALESAIYRLRRLLGSQDVVSMAAGKVSLNPQRLWVDVWEFLAELKCLPNEVAGNKDWIARIRALHRGAFLQQEVDQPWVLQAREEFRDQSLNAVRAAAHECERRQQWESAIELYQLGIEIDSMNENLYRALMHCHQELGNHSEALRAYQRCRDLLSRCLGVAPSDRTETLYLTVRQRAATAFHRERAAAVSSRAN
jgi:LuxR family transcriptional regulator, maltose regulon positive regulatory protein